MCLSDLLKNNESHNEQQKNRIVQKECRILCLACLWVWMMVLFSVDYIVRAYIRCFGGTDSIPKENEYYISIINCLLLLEKQKRHRHFLLTRKIHRNAKHWFWCVVVVFHKRTSESGGDGEYSRHLFWFFSLFPVCLNDHNFQINNENHAARNGRPLPPKRTNDRSPIFLLSFWQAFSIRIARKIHSYAHQNEWIVFQFWALLFCQQQHFSDVVLTYMRFDFLIYIRSFG